VRHKVACTFLVGLSVTRIGSPSFAASEPSPPARAAAAVDTKRIVHADREPGNWMSIGRTYDEQRFSPLKVISEKNVGKLGLAWYYDLNTNRGIEGTPVVVDGVMYATSAWTVTIALDAKTGKELWRYDPKVPPEWSRFVCCDVVSRGLAMWEDKVIVGTLDGRLIALDARTGTPIWTTMTVDNKEWPYSITGAPRVFNGKVVIGNGGVEFGVRGYISAYDVNTGKLIWRFWTVPGNPADGFENKTMEMAAKTWSGQWWVQGGGGAVWDSIVYDPEFNRIYFGTGNGAPWPHKLRSEGKGDNLFLASIVALDADTGEYVWHYQMIPADSWDFDVTQPMILADLRIDGKKRKVIMQAPKHGFFYVIDRRNGKLISAAKFVDHNNFASDIDIGTGRPVLLPTANYDTERRSITPNSYGAHSWQPISYNPRTGLVYFPVLENWEPYEIDPNYKPQKFRVSVGLGEPSDSSATILKEFLSQRETGYLTAWDPVRQKEVWRVVYDKGGNGGTLTTAGNLVAEGTSDQTFVIYRATDGAKLWEKGVQTVPTAGPMTYMVDGEQYIAVSAGGVGFNLDPRKKPTQRSSGRILAFKLGANGELPPLPPAPEISPPPFMTDNSEKQVRLGSAAYHRTCAQCHGRDAISVTAIPDLRYMSPETRAQFKDIVLKGVRSEKGMQNFADSVSEAEVDAINAYLVARAWEDRDN
jgi:quinohemoprotein ethanol dehydrogenase